MRKDLISKSFLFVSIWYNIVVATLSVMDITQDSGSRNRGSIPLGWSVIPIRKASFWLFLFVYAHKSLSVKSSELFKGELTAS